MLFNSLHFLIFFPLVTICYYLLGQRQRWILLLAASCYFYMIFKPVYILILFFTIGIDYVAGICIEKSQGEKRKWFLILSLIANISVLAFFKYYNFIAFNLNVLLDPVGWGNVPLLEILLPIGLSFHTFQSMSYTINVYTGDFKAEKHFGYFALYVMYYPQLVAGPIERPEHILPQLRKYRPFEYSNVSEGMKQMLYGFFKKVVVADNLGKIVDATYLNYEHLYGTELIATFIFFSFQIYCDFSGYSDIALGSSRVMGIKLMNNFNFPYFSRSIGNFWKRWHISLSTWFRDYLYIPLGGNRVPPMRRTFNVLFVFTISGLWHGANWTFLFWGFIHGAMNSIEDVLRHKSGQFRHQNKWLRSLQRFASTIAVFIIVTFAWVFFRSPDIGTAFELISRSLVFDQGALGLGFLSGKTYTLGILVLFVVFEFVIRHLGFNGHVNAKPLTYRLSVYSSLLVFILYFGVLDDNTFTYFQF